MTTLYLVTGFLGAGKTTFLKERLRESRVRTGVLVNDFGKIRYDGLLLSRPGLDLLELTNGSIFCSCLKDSFIDGLAELIERSLDEIYIESSGLADPSDMDKILVSVRLRLTRGDFIYGGAVCLVDALFFPKVLPKMLSAERQVRHSHLIVINKCDLAAPETVDAVEQMLKQLNPAARIARTAFGRLDWEHLKPCVFRHPRRRDDHTPRPAIKIWF
jgi:G3E family GTPase